MDAILKKGDLGWIANFTSKTSSFHVPRRSVYILRELCEDGFVATHSSGGLAFDVSLGGRPVRLSPIGRAGNASTSKKRKTVHRKKSGKRKKRDKRGKRKNKHESVSI